MASYLCLVNALIHVQMYHIPNHCALELIYEKSLRQTDLLYDEERIRRLRLQILLHEDENDHLHEQLAQDDNCIDELEGLCSQLQTALDAARDSLERAQSEVRLKSREIETLKVSHVENIMSNDR